MKRVIVGLGIILPLMLLMICDGVDKEMVVLVVASLTPIFLASRKGDLEVVKLLVTLPTEQSRDLPPAGTLFGLVFRPIEKPAASKSVSTGIANKKKAQPVAKEEPPMRTGGSPFGAQRKEPETEIGKPSTTDEISQTTDSQDIDPKIKAIADWILGLKRWGVAGFGKLRRSN